ncbi:MAG: DUF1043 family protein [Woeseiaceae bacterium]|nr:DUF1043 family protein [Woeseiaceae bacterium]
MNAILLASVGVVILLVGGGIGFWVGRSGIVGGQSRAEKAEAELEDYKRSVTEHFGQTAAHFQAIGKQYRDLYEHMASGAQVLCEPDEAGQQLLFAPEAEEQPEDAQQAEAAEKRAEVAEAPDSADAEVKEEPVPESAAEPQPEAQPEAEERTLH